MGIGVLRTDRLDMVVVAKHQLTPPEWAQWQRAVSKASELLYDATQGQLRIGNVYFADDGNGEASADMILYPSGDPSFNSGRFGTSGAAIHLMPYVKEEVLTVLHELGHSLWALGEEYSQSPTSHPIDTSPPAPNKKTIPIVESTLANDELVADEARALLTIAGQIERRDVVANTSTSITVDADYSVLPTDADTTTVRIQRPAECATDEDANFCIMENSRDAAGELQPDGTWVPAAQPVTEFCTDSNHDPDADTDQESDHGDSCWETIANTPGYTGFSVPNPADPGPAAGSPPVTFFVLDPDPRFAIVLDRSGSMGEGTKLPDAQHGAVYWVEFCTVTGDQLTVIWYDQTRSVLLPLVEVDSLTSQQREDLIDEINALTPGGATGIRDALFESLTQLSSPPTRAATQVSLLLTDGKHNTPIFSSAEEAVPTLRENGVRVYTLGVGAPNEVDMPTLDAIAEGTGGRSYAVGSGDESEIETTMVEINAEVRGGIIDSVPATLPDADRSDADEQLYAAVVGKEERPPFEKVAGMLGLRPSRKEWSGPRGRAVSLRMFVEEGAERCSFSLLHPETDMLWLYLVDPDGQPVDVGAPGHDHVRSRAPHEFSVVRDPKPGWWTLIVVRPQAGPEVRCRVIGGIENRKLRTYAVMPAQAVLKSAVTVEAGASYGLPLTAVEVAGRLTTPSGGRVGLAFSDYDGREHTGVYRSSFLPTRVGLYRGAVTITGTPRSRSALELTRIMHLEDPGAGVLDLSNDAPLFRRTIPVQVLVRSPRTVIEDDKLEQKYIESGSGWWKRPTRLSSAKLPRE